eukprot:g6539.t1
MIFLPAKGIKGDISFEGDTLIVPVVSTGNIGQLAVDLFLSSGRVQSPPLVEKVGYLDSDRVAPAAGYEVFGPGQPPSLCVNLELHRFAKSGVTVLQQRGAVLPGEERAFAADLVKWARESGFKDILALTGADAAEGLDPTPIGRGGMKRFRAGTSVEASRREQPWSPEQCALEEALSGAGIGAFDVAGVVQGGWKNLLAAPMGGGSLDAPGVPAAGGVGLGAEGGGNGNEDEESAMAMAMAMTMAGHEAALPTLPPLPSGTGVAGYLCTEASAAPEEEGIGAATPPLVVLLRFCGEGDNTPEAFEVAQAVNASLHLLAGGDGEGDVRWSSPLSWASLYGPPPSSDAYQ